MSAASSGIQGACSSWKTVFDNIPLPPAYMFFLPPSMMFTRPLESGGDVSFRGEQINSSKVPFCAAEKYSVGIGGNLLFSQPRGRSLFLACKWRDQECFRTSDNASNSYHSKKIIRLSVSIVTKKTAVILKGKMFTRVPL